MSLLIIPLDVMPDIFFRLPVEALLRFRSLSKTCCSLIDSPEFVNLHLNQSIKTRSVRTIFIIKPKAEGSIYAVDLDSSDMCPVKLKDVKSGPGKCLVIGSCNGLLAVKIGKKISLWNPWTRKSRILTLSATDSLFSFFGLGYDATSDDYKLIIVKPQRYQNHSRVFIHSSKTNSSRRIDDLDLSYFSIGSKTWGVFHGGSLYWIYNHKGNIRIMAFDLGEEKFNDLMLPNKERHLSMMSIVELGGCLSISRSFHRDLFEIWIMKEYGVEESWAKLLSFSFIELQMNLSRWEPLCYSRTGDEVVLTNNSGEFVWYDLEQERVVKRVDFLISSEKPVSANICVRSLVPLNNNLEHTRTGKKTQEKKEWRIKIGWKGKS